MARNVQDEQAVTIAMVGGKRRSMTGTHLAKRRTVVADGDTTARIVQRHADSLPETTNVGIRCKAGLGRKPVASEEVRYGFEAYAAPNDVAPALDPLGLSREDIVLVIVCSARAGAGGERIENGYDRCHAAELRIPLRRKVFNEPIVATANIGLDEETGACLGSERNQIVWHRLARETQRWL